MKKRFFLTKRFLCLSIAAVIACSVFAASAGAREEHALVDEVFTLILDNYVDELPPSTLAEGALSGVEEELKAVGKYYKPMPTFSSDKGLSSADRNKALEAIDAVFEGISLNENTGLEEAALRGMFKKLDQHSLYLDTAAYKDIQAETRGEFVGIGLQLTLKHGELSVISAIEDTPAYRAGLKAGDMLIAIDGVSSKGMSVASAIKHIRGKKGTVVTLDARRSGVDRTLEFKITREQIKIKSVKSRPLEGGIGYLRVSQFQENTAEEVSAELVKLGSRDNKLKGLILDLRNNPGGLLLSAVDVADEFIDAGTIVYLKGRTVDANARFESKSTRPRPYYPIAVLVNEGSASAAEVVAGALQDLNRGVLIGNGTFGKGTVQTLFPLKNNNGVRLTTARYHFFSGRAVSGGLTPDAMVEEKEGADRPLEIARRALENALKDGVAVSNDKLRKAAQDGSVSQKVN